MPTGEEKKKNLVKTAFNNARLLRLTVMAILFLRQGLPISDVSV